MYLQLARMTGASGEADIQLRLLAADQLLRSGYVQEGQRVLDPVLDQLGMGRAATRLGALWRFLWRRALLRVRGFGYHEHKGAEMTARELLRMDACRAASWTTAVSRQDCLPSYQLIALRAGEPVRVGVALFFESFYACRRGTTAAPRITRILERLTVVAERTGEPYLLGLAATARCQIEWAQGEWLHSREHAAQALQIFRERCPEAAYEAILALQGYFESMIPMGDLSGLVRELPPLLRDAEERRDRFTLTVLHTGRPVALRWLIQDQPETVRRQIRKGVDLFKPNARDSLVLLSAQLSCTMIELYQGDGASAYRRIDQSKRQNQRLRFDRGWLLAAHGISALAAFRAGALDHRKLVREVARDARSLRALRMAWTDALARVLDAGVTIVMGDHALARDQLERAHAEFTAAGMKFWAMMARWRLGELIGGVDGQEAIAEADAWLSAQGVVSPERLARVFMPEVA